MKNHYKQIDRFNFLYELQSYNIEPYLIAKGKEILSKAGHIAKKGGFYVSACFMLAVTLYGAVV